MGEGQTDWLFQERTGPERRAVGQSQVHQLVTLNFTFETGLFLPDC